MAEPSKDSPPPSSPHLELTWLYIECTALVLTSDVLYVSSLPEFFLAFEISSYSIFDVTLQVTFLSSSCFKPITLAKTFYQKANVSFFLVLAVDA